MVSSANTSLLPIILNHLIGIQEVTINYHHQFSGYETMTIRKEKAKLHELRIRYSRLSKAQ